LQRRWLVENLWFEIELLTVGQAPQGEPQSKATVTGK